MILRFTLVDAKPCSCGMTNFQVAWRDGTVEQLHYSTLPQGLTDAEADALRSIHRQLSNAREA